MKPVVIVAGVGPGIGTSIARAFGAEGFAIALLARDSARLAKRHGEITAAGIMAAPLVVDLADARATQNAVERGTWLLHPDGTMDVTWRLRPTIKWHDGTPFSSGDLLFSFTVFMDPDAGETYLIANPGYGITADQKFWTEKMGKGVPATYNAKRDYDAVELRVDKRFSKSYQFTDRGLTAGTSVQYRVRAVDGRNTASAFSPIASATVGQSAEPAETWPDSPWTNTRWQPQRDSWFDWGGW